jgi:Protein of unknown function (DUF3179)
MNTLFDRQWLDRRRWRNVAIASLVLAVASMPLVYGFERLLLNVNRDGHVSREAPPQPFLRRESPGLIRPPISGVQASGMRDEDEVIGVEIGGRARAYRLAALSQRTTHVVNDLIDGVPVTVAYCDLTDCVRTYADPLGRAPLGFSVGGLYVDNGPQMVLRLDDVFYLHKSGKSIEQGTGPSAIPYDTIEPTRTTWKEWVRRHPDTDVYTGNPPIEPK